MIRKHCKTNSYPLGTNKLLSYREKKNNEITHFNQFWFNTQGLQCLKRKFWFHLFYANSI